MLDEADFDVVKTFLHTDNIKMRIEKALDPDVKILQFPFRMLTDLLQGGQLCDAGSLAEDRLQKIFALNLLFYAADASGVEGIDQITVPFPRDIQIINHIGDILLIDAEALDLQDPRI